MDASPPTAAPWLCQCGQPQDAQVHTVQLDLHGAVHHPFKAALGPPKPTFLEDRRPLLERLGLTQDLVKTLTREHSIRHRPQCRAANVGLGGPFRCRCDFFQRVVAAKDDLDGGMAAPIQSRHG